jgi:thiol-disulfide isomerase/thioredoxin
MPVQRKTRKNSRVLNVRSGGAVKSFEKLLGKGPLTLVYVNAKWCGACHKFNDEVWEPLTKLKNRSVNLASVDSEMIGNTSLANVPRNFYPTLMLVGKDKKPATFEDEGGEPTNAMPRNSTLSEDREALSNLVINPTLKNNSVKLNSLNNLSYQTAKPNTPSVNKLNKTVKNNKSFKQIDPLSLSGLTTSPVNRTISMIKNFGTPQKQVLTSTAPSVESDLLASQKPQASETMVGGMLNAIRRKTASLRAMLNLRNHSTRKNRK